MKLPVHIYFLVIAYKLYNILCDSSCLPVDKKKLYMFYKFMIKYIQEYIHKLKRRVDMMNDFYH